MNPKIRNAIVAYVGWAGLFALSLWLVFLLQQNLVQDIFFLKINPWQLRFIRQWSIVLFGAIWIVYVFISEGYLRLGIEDGRLGRRFLNVGTPLLLLFALSWGLRLFG